LCGADAVIVEANHDVDMLRYGDYPYHLKKRILSSKGHLSNDDCAALVAKLYSRGTKLCILAHLRRENNTPTKALSTVKASLCGSDAQIFVAPEAEPLSIEIGGEDKC
ncbi:MAG: MBL fold metallo-hydrolase, partial [Oscillospiraceae bacterium]|nr:MBL fold metallo-hydrolase [Oscillospiraceae bacterium]